MASNSPHEWLGLLKWSLAYQDGTRPSNHPDNIKPMSKEDIEFLDNVMKSLVRDEVKAMTDAFETLVNYNKSGRGGGGGGGGHQKEEDEQLQADIIARLEDLQDIVEQIDMAGAFIKIGGPGCLLELVTAADKLPGPRVQAAAVIAALCQNNESVQAAFVKAGAIPLLLRLVTGKEKLPAADVTAITRENSSHAGPLVNVPMDLRVKCLTALSAVTRGNPQAEADICGEGGGSSGGGGGGGAQTREGSAQQQQSNSLAMFHSIFCPVDITTTSYAAVGDDKLSALQQKAIFFMKALILADGPDDQQKHRVSFFLPYLKRIVELLAGTCVADGGGDGGTVMPLLYVVVDLCLQLLLTCAKIDSKSVTAEIGGSMTALMQQRTEWCKQTLAKESGGSGGGGGGEDDDGQLELDKENATLEIDMWEQWQRLTASA